MKLYDRANEASILSALDGLGLEDPIEFRFTQGRHKWQMICVTTNGVVSYRLYGEKGCTGLAHSLSSLVIADTHLLPLKAVRGWHNEVLQWLWSNNAEIIRIR